LFVLKQVHVTRVHELHEALYMLSLNLYSKIQTLCVHTDYPCTVREIKKIIFIQVQTRIIIDQVKQFDTAHLQKTGLITKNRYEWIVIMKMKKKIV